MDRPTLKGEAGAGGLVPSGAFGRLSFGFLAVSVLSGIALVPFWSPTHPLASVERLQGGLPWGFFLRALHADSSFGLLVTAVAHLVQVISRRTEGQVSAPVWWRSVLLVPLTVAALLGGFVLRGDAAAVAALTIWRRITESVPVVGTELSRLLLGPASQHLGAVALHHAGIFTLLLWLLTAEHGGRLLPDVRSAVLAGLVSAALAGAIPLSLGPPPGVPAARSSSHILLGPWYLLGLQGALVDLPVWAGWAGPLLPLFLLGLLRHAAERFRRALLALLGAWTAAYLLFTARVLLFSGG